MNIVLVWVWWSWISWFAYFLYELWYKNIVWIEKEKNQITDDLQKIWIKIIIWHWIYKVNETDVIVYVDPAKNSVEVEKWFENYKFWKKKSVPPISYKWFTWELSKYFKTIWIAGSHWKSTTTSMCINLFSSISKEFWLGFVWALVPQFGNKNYLINKNIKDTIKSFVDNILFWIVKNIDYSTIKKYYFIIEADEYNKNFLLLDLDYAIITNIEYDHSDIFWSKEEYIDSFYDYIKLVKSKVFVLDNLKYLSDNFENIKILKQKKINYKYIFWDHNIKNWSLCYWLAKNLLKSNSIDLIQNLENFKWIWRRIEYLKKLDNWAILYSDYWHHPTELNAVIDALKTKFKTKKIVWIFQPHQARRIIDFYDEFVEVLKKYDEVCIYKIYAARESIDNLNILLKNKWKQTISNFDEIWDRMSKEISCKYYTKFENIIEFINSYDDNYIIVYLSAWDIDYDMRNYLKIF